MVAIRLHLRRQVFRLTSWGLLHLLIEVPPTVYVAGELQYKVPCHGCVLYLSRIRRNGVTGACRHIFQAK